MMRSPRLATFLSLLLLSSAAMGQDDASAKVPEVRKRPAAPSREFYELKQNLDALTKQMNQLRVDVEARRGREITPEIYRLLLKRLTPVKMSHEVVLTNGTIVRGNLLEEKTGDIVLETTLGNLTLSKASIRSINEMVDLEPNPIFKGDAEEEFYDGYRIYEGQIINEGASRADFVRIVFMLWDSDSKLVAKDSAFVAGSEVTYLSGVAADTALEPAQELTYQVRVNVGESNKVTYMTREIHYDRVD